ncbi:MAG: LamG-like jellyroll fold domain-containing protein [bacterium]|nr:LamG-like jellyroll fold domain-containing protein [bacterium]
MKKTLGKALLACLILFLIAYTLVEKQERKLWWEFAKSQDRDILSEMTASDDLIYYLPLHFGYEELVGNHRVNHRKPWEQCVDILGPIFGLNMALLDEPNKVWLPFTQSRKDIPSKGESFAVGFYLSSSISKGDDDVWLPLASIVEPTDHRNPQQAFYINQRDHYIHYASFFGGLHAKHIRIEDGTYYYLVSVVDLEAQEYRLYINGQIAEKGKITQENNHSAEGLYLGAFFPGAHNIDGVINEVALWKRPLSEIEVQGVTSKVRSKNRKMHREFVWLIRVFLLLLLYFLYWKTFQKLGSDLANNLTMPSSILPKNGDEVQLWTQKISESDPAYRAEQKSEFQLFLKYQSVLRKQDQYGPDGTK